MLPLLRGQEIPRNGRMQLRMITLLIQKYQLSIYLLFGWLINGVNIEIKAKEHENTLNPI